MYAVRPDGSQLWRYDTGEPVRSSPVVGRAPKGDGQIVYVGSSNGKLYALDAETGRRRWSFDTTPSRPPLSDRNDLNGSPALGRRGVYIGGEHGWVWFVPYDYCLQPETTAAASGALGRSSPPTRAGAAGDPGRHHAARARRAGAGRDRARRAAGRPPRRGDPRRADARTPGLATRWSRSSRRSTSRPSSPATAITCSSAPTASSRRDTDYRVRCPGEWAAPAASGGFDDTLRFHTEPSRGELGLRAGRNRVGALEHQPPGAAAALAAAEREPDRLRLLRPDRGHAGAAEPNAAAGRILLWVIGAQREAATGSRSPTRAATSPSRSRAPTRATW